MKFGYLIEPPFNHKTLNGTVTGSDIEYRLVRNSRT